MDTTTYIRIVSLQGRPLFQVRSTVYVLYKATFLTFEPRVSKVYNCMIKTQDYTEYMANASFRLIRQPGKLHQSVCNSISGKTYLRAEMTFETQT